MRYVTMVCFKKSLLFRAQKGWTIPNIEPDIFFGELPPYIRESNTLSVFRKKLFTYF